MSILDSIIESADRRKKHKIEIVKKRKYASYKALPDNNQIKDRIKKMKALEDEAIKNIQRSGEKINESE